MERKTLVAATEVVDQDAGTFEALVSTWDADREGDTILRTAFDRTIAAWRATGKAIPLLFEHSDQVVGAISPDTMFATEAGLIAAGQIDRESERGDQSWRMIKSGVAGFSIGYMSDSRPRKGGGRELIEVDLLEVSVTCRPMNASTRALNWKAATDELPTESDQRRLAARLMMTPEQERELDQWLGVFNEAINGTKASEPRTKSTRPIRIASFEC